MAGQTGYTAEIIRDRLNKLVTLFDITENLKDQVMQIRFDQTSAVWPSEIPSVADFASRYRQTLWDVEQQLGTIRDSIEANRQALDDSYRSLNRVDETIDELLRGLQERIDSRPTPVNGSTTARQRQLS
ncbi:hypothetical protein [Cellulomonas pakistanensis]|uniref:Uncharacterized protein n=1 Tax=Cellulomonas pakistanensis TaxID=992287 RepID=A0A919U6I6_9CELL|nr:hypothetical protein [Cellulomonas pakistanensis]GIG36072.1 hypothetical protein Cpa01nite_14530 [Cellulomonas pakistanensis]